MDAGKTRLLWVLSAIALALLSLGLFVARWIAFSPGNTGTTNPDGGRAGDAQSSAGGPNSEPCPIAIGTMRQPSSSPAPSRGGAPSGRIGGNQFSTPPPPVGGAATAPSTTGRPGISPAGKRYIAAYNTAGKDADSLCKEALCYMREGVYSEAERALKASLRLDPNQVNARGLLGTIYAYRSLAYSKAAAEFSKVLELVPNESQSLIGRGWCEMAMANYTAAKRDFEQYVRLNPKSGTSYMALGVLDYFRGNRARSAKRFAEGAEKAPSYTPNRLWGVAVSGAHGRAAQATELAYAALFEGSGTPVRFISAADKRGLGDSAIFFFLGKWALARGAKSDAAKYFRASLREGAPDMFRIFSDIELMKLEGAE